jgi:hypothetical protein
MQNFWAQKGQYLLDCVVEKVKKKQAIKANPEQALIPGSRWPSP